MNGEGIAVLGLQWGDEGKGKIVDFLSSNCDAVVRFGGGANAGHTIIVDAEKVILRLMPSGILHKDKICMIGHGVVLDPEVLETEIKSLQNRNIMVKDRLFIDHAAHLVLPLHKALDSLEDDCRGDCAIGTTKRGIGPAYASRVSRLGIRVADIFNDKILSQKASHLHKIYGPWLNKIPDYGQKTEGELISYIAGHRKLFEPLMADIGPKVLGYLGEGKRVLFEGAQGSLLDVDCGTYPFTTSSHTTIGGILVGLGIPPGAITSAIGVVKAYTTRVGQGCFPTEISGELADRIRAKGNEFGSVTGRPRRIGWLDLVALKRMIRLNGIDKIALTKLDVLDGLNEIYVCEKYEVNGKVFEDFPPNHPDFATAHPIYSRMDGWPEFMAGVTDLKKLPINARKYLDYIEKSIEVPFMIISTGHERLQSILLN
jgi:adenylosuccinate synthase